MAHAHMLWRAREGQDEGHSLPLSATDALAVAAELAAARDWDWTTPSLVRRRVGWRLQEHFVVSSGGIAVFIRAATGTVEKVVGAPEAGG